eukprot:g17218.t1
MLGIICVTESASEPARVLVRYPPGKDVFGIPETEFSRMMLPRKKQLLNKRLELVLDYAHDRHSARLRVSSYPRDALADDHGVVAGGGLVPLVGGDRVEEVLPQFGGGSGGGGSRNLMFIPGSSSTACSGAGGAVDVPESCKLQIGGSSSSSTSPAVLQPTFFEGHPEHTNAVAKSGDDSESDDSPAPLGRTRTMMPKASPLLGLDTESPSATNSGGLHRTQTLASSAAATEDNRAGNNNYSPENDNDDNEDIASESASTAPTLATAATANTSQATFSHSLSYQTPLAGGVASSTSLFSSATNSAVPASASAPSTENSRKGQFNSKLKSYPNYKRGVIIPATKEEILTFNIVLITQSEYAGVLNSENLWKISRKMSELYFRFPVLFSTGKVLENLFVCLKYFPGRGTSVPISPHIVESVWGTMTTSSAILNNLNKTATIHDVFDLERTNSAVVNVGSAVVGGTEEQSLQHAARTVSEDASIPHSFDLIPFLGQEFHLNLFLNRESYLENGCADVPDHRKLKNFRSALTKAFLQAHNLLGSNSKDHLGGLGDVSSGATTLYGGTSGSGGGFEGGGYNFGGLVFGGAVGSRRGIDTLDGLFRDPISPSNVMSPLSGSAENLRGRDEQKPARQSVSVFQEVVVQATPDSGGSAANAKISLELTPPVSEGTLAPSSVPASPYLTSPIGRSEHFFNPITKDPNIASSEELQPLAPITSSADASAPPITTPPATSAATSAAPARPDAAVALPIPERATLSGTGAELAAAALLAGNGKDCPKDPSPNNLLLPDVDAAPKVTQMLTTLTPRDENSSDSHLMKNLNRTSIPLADFYLNNEVFAGLVTKITEAAFEDAFGNVIRLLDLLSAMSCADHDRWADLIDELVGVSTNKWAERAALEKRIVRWLFQRKIIRCYRNGALYLRGMNLVTQYACETVWEGG